MQDTSPNDSAELIDAVLRASRVLVSVAARSLADVDEEVTLPQYRALVVLAGRGAQRPGDLAAALGSHPSTVTRLCDRLVAKKLVERHASPSNRREVSIALTTRGRRLVDRVTIKRRAELAAILDRVAERERALMVRVLDALGDAADEPADAGWPG
jgi:DNA-binding MarR family transcriptional regulator